MARLSLTTRIGIAPRQVSAYALIMPAHMYVKGTFSRIERDSVSGSVSKNESIDIAIIQVD